jgi:hypothetical protein
MFRPTNWTRSFIIPCILRCTVLFFLHFGVPDPASAGTPILRNVLVLYNSLDGQSLRENIVFETCQTVLNYYGLLCDYRDVNRRPLPGAEDMQIYRGVITAFASEKINKAQDYLSWLNQQLDVGKKVVVLNQLGGDPSSNPEISRLRGDVCRKLGMVEEDDFTTNRAVIRYERKDEEGVEFERKYPPLPREYEQIKPVDPLVKTYLSLKRTDREGSESSVILTSPAGGYARSEFIFWQDPATFRKQWYLNPFRFFEEALDLHGLPMPDPTTLNGLRVAFSHIDGDSFAGLSKIDSRSLCGEIIFREILKKYDFPVTVSIIVAEVDPKALGDERHVELARRIFALPNVEPASHAYSHPFYWDPEFKGKDRYASQYGLKIPGYEFDLKMEIDHSLDYISRVLSPPDKPCKVMLWTGNCLPNEEAVARCDQLGCLNMNGGDTLFDDYNNSYTSVAPLYRPVGKTYQYHIGQANDNILTNLWKGPYYGYRKIITTMKRTGSPRRIKPIDIYHHFFSAQLDSSLKALQEVYDWVIHQPIAPVFTSDYIRMVRGFIDTRMERDGDAFVIEEYGHCLTVRFDMADGVPDLRSCENVVGYAKEPEGLYVSLAPGKKRAVIVFSAPRHPSSSGEGPYVATASGWVTDVEAGQHTIRLQFKGYRSGRMRLGGWVPGKRYDVKGSAVQDREGQVDADGKGFLVIEPVRTGTLEITGH